MKQLLPKILKRNLRPRAACYYSALWEVESQVRDSALVGEASASRTWECCGLSIRAREKVEGLSSFNHNASSRLRSGMTHTLQSLAESTFAESTLSHTRKRQKGGMCEVAHHIALFLRLKHSFETCHLSPAVFLYNQPLCFFLVLFWFVMISKRLSFLFCEHSPAGKESQSLTLHLLTLILRSLRHSKQKNKGQIQFTVIKSSRSKNVQHKQII